MPTENLDLNRVQVIIPALNEQDSIVGVISELQGLGFKQIRVVDNGSSDLTALRAAEAGAEVIHEDRRGYGQACWTGYQQLPDVIQWVLFCDADGSDSLQDLKLLLAEVEGHDFILGNRRASKQGRAAMTEVQNFGNGLATSLIRWGWGGMYDDLGPMRLIRNASLIDLQMKDRGFGWTVEMQVRAVEEKLRVKEVPVRYNKRKAGQSKISGTIKGSVQAGTIILSTLFSLYWKGKAQGLLSFISALFILFGCWLLQPHGDLRVTGSVPHFLSGVGVMSIGFILSWRIKILSVLSFWVVAVLARMILVPMAAGDDIWRYLWEGWVQVQGFNPYELAPASDVLQGIRTLWWNQINHAEVTAIYPPLTQLGFRLLAGLGLTVLNFKLAFIAADLLVCGLLLKRYGALRASLYAWNPVIIYSFAGGAHYDAWFILALTLGWLIWEGQTLTGCVSKGLLSAFCLGCGVALKYVCAPLLAWVIWNLYKNRGIWVAGAAAVLSTFPFILSFLLVPDGLTLTTLVPKDFSLYARSAEFIPHYVGLLWEGSQRINWIFAVPVGLVILGRFFINQKLELFAEDFFFGLFIFTPVVHLWYFTWVIPFLVATNNWGWRLVSMSGFLYFILQHRVNAEGGAWSLTEMERLTLWLPLLAGFVWTRYKGYVNENT